MKRLFLFLSAILTLLSTDVSAKTLVVYYSYTGNCREIVNTLTSQIEADILEIYASEEAYQQHLKTPHFQKYKQGTLHMVKDLKLPTMKPLDPETMKLIFRKQR